ncbi:MAG TPA: cytochrome c peroxidase [Syntrophorhabdales bacterium]|nr:cytochrome c peroxidase [Syntrophorhabdales bacterium]
MISFRRVGIILNVILLAFLAASAPWPVLADDGGTLLSQAKQAFGQLPATISSEGNPITPEKVALGKILFYETRISVDGTVSCARCHPMGLYAADGLRKSIGNNSKVNPRNAPTILNAASQMSAHWIGNRLSVEDQAKQALTGPPSFGMPSYEAAENKLKEIKGYPALFQKAFPGQKEPVTADNFAKALGAFERTLVTPSPFDGYLKGNKTGLSDSEKRGLQTFMQAGCAGCHAGPYLGGQMYQKFGIIEPYWKYTKSADIDEGRYTVTKNESDKYVFKVPILRNVGRTAPYFHDGSTDHLYDAVWIMGKVQLAKDLSKTQVEDILSFLRALTGSIPEKDLEIPILPPSE